MWMVAERAAQRHATSSTSPNTSSRARPHRPPIRNWAQRKAKRSARTFTARFHPACRTAAVSARTVASTTAGGPVLEAARSGPQDVDDQRQGRRWLAADLDPAVERFEGVVEAAGIVEVQFEHRLAGLDLVALLGEADDP